MKLKTLAVVCASIAKGSIAKSSIALASMAVAGSAIAQTEVNFWYSGGTQPQQMMTKLIEEFNASQDEYVIRGALQGNYQETFQRMVYQALT